MPANKPIPADKDGRVAVDYESSLGWWVVANPRENFGGTMNIRLGSSVPMSGVPMSERFKKIKKKGIYP